MLTEGLQGVKNAKTQALQIVKIEPILFQDWVVWQVAEIIFLLWPILNLSFVMEQQEVRSSSTIKTIKLITLSIAPQMNESHHNRRFPTWWWRRWLAICNGWLSWRQCFDFHNFGDGGFNHYDENDNGDDDVGDDNGDDDNVGDDDDDDIGDDDDYRLGATNVGGEYPSSSKVCHIVMSSQLLLTRCFGKQLAFKEPSAKTETLRQTFLCPDFDLYCSISTRIA